MTGDCTAGPEQRCCPLLLLPSIFPSIRVFSNESALPICVEGALQCGPVVLGSPLQGGAQASSPSAKHGAHPLQVRRWPVSSSQQVLCSLLDWTFNSELLSRSARKPASKHKAQVMVANLFPPGDFSFISSFMHRLLALLPNICPS